MERRTRIRAVSALAAILLLGLVVAGCSQAETGTGTADTEAGADTETADDTAAPDSGDDSPPPEDEPEPPAEDDEGDEPPGETTAPEETTPPDDGEGTDEGAEASEDLAPSDVPVWTWVLAGLILLGAIVWMASRAGASGDEDSDAA